ncbi:unnamed protein product [Dovyalis caffra]|uniref:Uncharacterized protein n=1 Tax=Dovyalis caffra TaxID=77055 RepID=A0AAV1QRX8_9ROSI|nr:unnamed protein product [Dovyalis caffra]
MQPAHPYWDRGIKIQPITRQSETKHGRNGAVAALDISGDIQLSQNTKNLHCIKHSSTVRKNELQASKLALLTALVPPTAHRTFVEKPSYYHTKKSSNNRLTKNCQAREVKKSTKHEA